MLQKILNVDFEISRFVDFWAIVYHRFSQNLFVKKLRNFELGEPHVTPSKLSWVNDSSFKQKLPFSLLSPSVSMYYSYRLHPPYFRTVPSALQRTLFSVTQPRDYFWPVLAGETSNDDGRRWKNRSKKCFDRHRMCTLGVARKEQRYNRCPQETRCIVGLQGHTAIKTLLFHSGGHKKGRGRIEEGWPWGLGLSNEREWRAHRCVNYAPLSRQTRH